MKRLDRYLLSQLMAIFGFFALVLVSVYWVNRAVLLFDRLIGDGQTAWVVLEFTALTLPKVIALVLPVAAFAAVLYAINRLSGESELVVMQATGASPWRLARPVAIFGLIVAALMLALVHELVPASRARLAERQAQVSQDVTARFLAEGSFQSPTEGITVYIREISDQGELLDIFLFDARSSSTETSYTAEKALIVASEAGPKLVMFDGTAQTLRRSDGSLALTRFADFTYDLGGAIGAKMRGRVDWEEVPSRDLIAPAPALLAATGSSVAAAHLELNDRLAQPLMAPVAALLAAAAMMLGGFSRFGLWRQMVLAVLALIGLQSLSNIATSITRKSPDLWTLHYLPVLAGLVLVALALGWAGRRRTSPGIAAPEGGGMTLSLYIARRFGLAFLIVAGAFWGVLFLIEMVEQIRRLDPVRGALTDAVRLAALSVPATLYKIFPLVVMLSGVVAFLGLARSSELVVIRAAGRSALRMLIAPVTVAALIGVALVAVGNPIVSATTQRAEEIEGELRAEGRQTVSIGREGLWMRQGTADGGQAVIHALRGNADATALYEVTFLLFDAKAGPVRRIDAASAWLTPGSWVLSDAKDWPLGLSTNPERDATRAQTISLPSTLTAESIADSFGAPSAMPIWELPGFIRALEAAGFSARRHIVWLQVELAQPLMLAAMVLVAAGFTMRPARFGGTGGRVMLALLAGLALFFLRNVAQVLGDNGQIPAALAAWAPPAIALMLALTLVLQQEEG